MNKKERAEYDRVLDECRLLAALRWTAPVAPDVPIPSEGLSIGYLPIASGSTDARVTEACSSSIYHGHSHIKTTTQNPKELYSTRILALRALRHSVERDCAERLARIDRQIAEVTP